MTDIQKKKGGNILDFVYKALVLTGVGGLVFSSGVFKEQIEQKSFSSPEMKVKTESYIETAPNEVDTYKSYIFLDSLTKAYAAERKLEKQYRDKQDSLIKRNSVTVYQLKQAQEKQTKISKEILVEIQDIKKNLNISITGKP